MRAIDLHVHSTYSDGTMTPAELLKLAEEKGLAAFALTGCFESSYSADSLKSGLERGGYTVELNPTIIGIETDKLDGYKSSVYGYKMVDDKEYGIIILIFDSIDNANKAGSPSGDVATEFMSQMHDWGRRHAPDTDLSVYGVANNIVWAGCQNAKTAAGIN